MSTSFTFSGAGAGVEEGQPAPVCVFYVSRVCKSGRENEPGNRWVNDESTHKYAGPRSTHPNSESHTHMHTDRHKTLTSFKLY